MVHADRSPHDHNTLRPTFMLINKPASYHNDISNDNFRPWNEWVRGLLPCAMLSTIVTVVTLLSLAVTLPAEVPQGRTVNIRGTQRPPRGSTKAVTLSRQIFKPGT